MTEFIVYYRARKPIQTFCYEQSKNQTGTFPRVWDEQKEPEAELSPPSNTDDLIKIKKNISDLTVFPSLP